MEISGSINERQQVIYSMSRTLEIILQSNVRYVKINSKLIENSVFIKEIDYMSKHIWDKAADSGTIVDFHDVMFKFTLDSFIL